MAQVNLDHINVCAPRALLAQVKAFYEDVLGLKEGFRPAFSSGGYWLYSGDRALVHLSERDCEPGLGHTTLDHVAFRVERLEPLTRKLGQRRIKYHTTRVDEIRLIQVFCQDPAGNRLEFNAVER